MEHRPNREGFNAAELALKDISRVNSFLRGVFSRDVSKKETHEDPTALSAGTLGDLASQATRGFDNIKLMMEFVETARHGGLTDDRKYMLEHIVQLAASLPSDSPLLKKLTSKFVQNLWQGLNHPPLSYLGDEWKYRTADGSNNNKMMPWLGRAGSYYARTVNPVTKLPPTLPDPGLIFDELFARGPRARPHPNKVSSMLFYLATIIIHDIFRTDDSDWNVASNSSYLDLAPLYGNSDDLQKAVRTMKDGKLKPDTFSEVRLLGFPPGVAALLCSFNRFHNYVAEQLAAINEGGRFSLVPKEHWTRALKEKYGTPEVKRDHDLFNTARLVTSGLYVNIILNDYVRTILALNATNSEWTLDPRADPSKIYGPSGIPEGIGNQVSAEFNLVYRWHSTVSPKDEKWTNDFFEKFLPGKNPETMDATDLRMAFIKFLQSVGDKPEAWTFGNLERGEDGAFRDEDLVRIMTESTDDRAAAFGARNVPIALKVVEKLGIEQARKWNLATLNEFRQFFGMMPHKSFTDINSDPSVAASLETLYGSPDLVELYPGLVAEETKVPMEPGAGLCPGFTVSKAILSDAVALVRGDRFYTVDYNATTLTNWGFTTASVDPQIAGGGVMYKLLHRAYPGWYAGDSVYAMYPFQTPEKMREILTKLGREKDFSFTPPALAPIPVRIQSWKGVADLLSDPTRFDILWDKKAEHFLHRQDPKRDMERPNRNYHLQISRALYAPKNWKAEIKALYEQVTLDLIKRNSKQLRSGSQLEMVQDLANPSQAIAVGRLFHMPIKTVDDPVNLMTPAQYHAVLSTLFARHHLDFDRCKDYELEAAARQAVSVVTAVAEDMVAAVKVGDWRAIAKRIAQATGLRPQEKDVAEDYGSNLIKRIIEGQDDGSVRSVAAVIVATATDIVPAQSQALVQALDLLMEDKYRDHWEQIQALARKNDASSFEILEKYALECMRLAPSFSGGVRVSVGPDSVVDDKQHGKKQIKKGDRVLLDLTAAGRDSEVFPDPDQIRLDRDSNLYIHHGWAQHTCIGKGIASTALAAQLRCVALCKNLRRAPGSQGRLQYFTDANATGRYLKEDWSDFWPFPTNMKFLHDGLQV